LPKLKTAGANYKRKKEVLPTEASLTGGFFFILHDPIRNKAGQAATDRKGRTQYPPTEVGQIRDHDDVGVRTLAS
jgi:hypothetical protein